MAVSRSFLAFLTKIKVFTDTAVISGTLGDTATFIAGETVMDFLLGVDLGQFNLRFFFLDFRFLDHILQQAGKLGKVVHQDISDKILQTLLVVIVGMDDRFITLETGFIDARSAELHVFGDFLLGFFDLGSVFDRLDDSRFVKLWDKLIISWLGSRDFNWFGLLSED
jgi:hypothetical protein